MGQDARAVQIDISSAFETVSHQGIRLKLCSVGVGDSVLSVVTQFLSNRPQYVVVNRSRSKMINGVPWGDSGKYFGSAIVPLVYRGAFLYSGKHFYGYADDPTLVDTLVADSHL